MLSKIKEKYIESGGQFRDLTIEEGYFQRTYNYNNSTGKRYDF